ncbi:hypothetical protein [Zavarzinella formosa]|uniref:hypothetical protein n=1 Tax=Zavarzinella formosa TaxID=360055 RepID=UPI00037855E5|nr:hypothetical protein [Zavarzinella formosa]
MNIVKRYPLPFVLVSLHTILATVVGAFVWTSDDGEAGMLWGIFWLIDWPVFRIVARIDGEWMFFVALMALGGVWWANIGWAIHWLDAGLRWTWESCQHNMSGVGSIDQRNS